MEGLSRCSCWTGRDAPASGSSTELGGGCRVPRGGPGVLGLPPDVEREVEAKTPGTCWGLLGGVPVDRADGRRHPSLQGKSPSWGPPAWPKPKEEVLPQARAPLLGEQARGWGGGQLGSPRLPRSRNRRDEEVLHGDLDVGAFPLTRCVHSQLGGQGDGGVSGQPSVHPRG